MHLEKVHIVQDRFPTLKYYPFDLDLLRKTTTLDFQTPVTFFVGENGTGKSTLLKAVAIRSGVNIWQGERRSAMPPILTKSSCSGPWTWNGRKGRSRGPISIRRFSEILPRFWITGPPTTPACWPISAGNLDAAVSWPVAHVIFSFQIPNRGPLCTGRAGNRPFPEESARIVDALEKYGECRTRSVDYCHPFTHPARLP